MVVKILFEEFINANDAIPTIEAFEKVKEVSGGTGYVSIRNGILPSLPFKHKQLFSTLDKRYNSDSIKTKSKVVVSGAGPCGLRAAVELALLGHHVTLIELRSSCSRHNILKTWQATVDDMMGFGLNIFVPGFKSHGLLHLGTREIQLCLLKVCLLFGVTVNFGEGVCGILHPSFTNSSNYCIWALPSEAARAYLQNPMIETNELALKPCETDTDKLEQTSKVDFFEKAISEDSAIFKSPVLRESDADYLKKSTLVDFNTLLIAEGESSRLIRRLGFDRKVAKYSEAIGIVVNLEFSSNPTKEERQLDEFQVWRASADWKKGPLGRLIELGVDLENMEYMRGNQIHFIAATTKLATLRNFGVVRDVFAKVKDTLIKDNMDFQKLRDLGRILAQSAGVPDSAPICDRNGVQAFDFSCKGVCVQPLKWESDVLILPIGDALQNPYWPQGLGVNRGFHNSLDAVWSAHQLALGIDKEEVERERRYCFRLLEWKTFSKLSVQSGKWTADPMTRYSPDLTRSIHMNDVENKAVVSSIPQRFRDAYGLKL
eukprot:NODE_115_length_18417_cov_0.666012.p3 type:complete len:544 gc:universal NODE_115_length_18417_cov_0.666012:12582-10951(-)